MNKELVEARIAQINADIVQTRERFTVLTGHLAEATHWVNDIVAKEKSKAESKSKEELELQVENVSNEDCDCG